eukprot:TRINITY_DN47790_c0_g1_i1.p1 TRINITY_DN47790_c0_g1~~TRINITY_DN47790_c0_g1_i1.p1  ORF type:complete len:501 (-),score=100.62 TRINITY_DN47790_c0_g1_i1:17-1483(-)
MAPLRVCWLPLLVAFVIASPAPTHRRTSTEIPVERVWPQRPVCSHRELLAANACWRALDEQGQQLQNFATCCAIDTPLPHCWKEEQFQVCCRCFPQLWKAVYAHLLSGHLFLGWSGASFDLAKRALNLSASLNLPAQARFLAEYLAYVNGQNAALAGLMEDDGPLLDGMLALICQLNVHVRSSTDLLQLQTAPGSTSDCVVNIFTSSCSGSHAAVFSALLPMEGPALEGQILDFLGVSTNASSACAPSARTGDILAGAAVSRYFECRYLIDNRIRRAWPILDEEYFEWVDVLTVAVAAAKRGGGLAMAEIGAGPYAIWLVRAAKAFLRWAALEDPCDLLLVEPDQLGDRSTLWSHVSRNIPEGRCNFHVVEDYVNDSVQLMQILDTAAKRASLWDLVDIDAQGAERAMILGGGLKSLAQRTRRLHVSSHSREIHSLLLAEMRDEGWTVPVHSPVASLSSVGKLGFFSNMDGHITALPPQRSATAEIWW